MKIIVTGTRGIPDIQGGVETHCEELFPRIAAMGHDVAVIRRDCYVNEPEPRSEFRGVRLIDIPTPRRKSFEAIVHTFRAVLRARREGCDILHIHAIGPALMTPLAKMLGMKVVVTHHGPDYDRQKWGRMARMMLRMGERMGAVYADRVIVISKVIDSLLHSKYRNVKTSLIYNGVPRASRSAESDYPESLGLEPGKYVVAVGRFVQEKNFHQLVEAFAKAKIKGWRLAIAGDADHPDAYSESLKRLAEDNGVVLTGFIKGERMRQLMSHAGLFVLPSSHEGLPISLLEAMSYHINVLVSDIPANMLPELESSDFFQAGDIDALSDALKRKISESRGLRNYDLTNYQWDEIARQTVEVYRSVIGK